MKLYITCSSCYKDIKIKQKATTKFEFERKFGEELEVNCKHCGTSNTKHVNRVFAKAEWFWVLISFGISVLLSLLLIFIIGGIGIVFITVPVLITFGQQKSINAFNRSMIPRR
jgi:hypothetical protein